MTALATHLTPSEWEQADDCPVHPLSTPAPGVSGETRALIANVIREALDAYERTPLPKKSPGEAADRAAGAVLAALAPGPDTARDGEVEPPCPAVFHSATCPRCHEPRGEFREFYDAMFAAADAARGERDDLKAAVERLCEQAETTGYETYGLVDADDLRALLTPPDAGRDR